MCRITAPSWELMGLSNGVEKVWLALPCPALPALPYPALLRIGPGARKIVLWTEPKERAFWIFQEELSLPDLSQSTSTMRRNWLFLWLHYFPLPTKGWAGKKMEIGWKGMRSGILSSFKAG